MAVKRVRFENTTEGFVGAITIDARGEHRGVAVEPHGTIELSEEEQIATANAPRHAEDSPFEEREEPEYDDEGKLLRTVKAQPQLIPVSASRPIPSTRPIPGTDPPTGSFRDGEEVGTPIAS
jgi:hypothetical protein